MTELFSAGYLTLFNNKVIQEFDIVTTSSCSLAAWSKSDWCLHTDSENDSQAVISWPSRYGKVWLLLKSYCPLGA